MPLTTKSARAQNAAHGRRTRHTDAQKSNRFDDDLKGHERTPVFSRQLHRHHLCIFRSLRELGLVCFADAINAVSSSQAWSGLNLFVSPQRAARGQAEAHLERTQELRDIDLKTNFVVVDALDAISLEHPAAVFAQLHAESAHRKHMWRVRARRKASAGWRQVWAVRSTADRSKRGPDLKVVNHAGVGHDHDFLGRHEHRDGLGRPLERAQHLLQSPRALQHSAQAHRSFAAPSYDPLCLPCEAPAPLPLHVVTDKPLP